MNRLDLFGFFLNLRKGNRKIIWACIDPVPSQGWVCNEPGPKTEKRWNKKADEDLLPSNILFFPLRYGCFNLSAMFSLHTKKRFNVHTWYRTMQIKTQVIPAPAKKFESKYMTLPNCLLFFQDEQNELTSKMTLQSKTKINTIVFKFG